MSSATESLSLHVVGAGLIGTSIALGARQAGFSVTLADTNIDQLDLARNLVRASIETSNPTLIVVAVPPHVTSQEVAIALDMNRQSIVLDVSSTKSKVVQDVMALSDKWDRFVPSHPIAGREVGGAASAQADLFQGRPWIITPLAGQDQAGPAITHAQKLIGSLGAASFFMSPEEHDRLFARISHLPQIISTALAAMSHENGDGLRLAGQGLKDMTRLAESDPKLWIEIFRSNRGQILDALRRFEINIAALKTAIELNNASAIESLFEEAKISRTHISGKHGSRQRAYSLFRIVVDDRPGVLAELFALSGKHGINIEDLDLEHSPSQETGLITLSVHPDQSSDFADVLTTDKWTFHVEGPRQ